MNLKAEFLKSEKEFEKWDKFVSNSEFGSIHQLSSWGKFLGEFWIIAIFESNGGEEKIIGGSLIVKKKLPFGLCWLYSPRGPLIEYWTEGGAKAFKVLRDAVSKFGKIQKAVFWRFDTERVESGGEAGQTLSAPSPRPSPTRGELDFVYPLTPTLSRQGRGRVGLRVAYAQYQPVNTLMIDLNLSEEEILKQMKPKGRYNIKLAEKKGVEVIESDGSSEDIAEFYRILKVTTSRDGFGAHDQQYYSRMISELGPEHVKLYLARFEGKIIAGIIVTFFEKRAIYYFGASDNLHRNIMAPYLLQWTAIKEAKKRGMSEYDFLGVAPKGASKNHPWAGVTDFKEKFGGKRVNFYLAREIVWRRGWYWLIRLRKILRFI